MVIMAFARSSYRRSSHFAIASLFLLRIIVRSPNFDLSISASSLGTSHQLFPYSCNRGRWRLYRSFLDPNNWLRRLDQHVPCSNSSMFENSRNPFLVLWCVNGCPSYRKSSLKSVFPPKYYLGGKRIFNLFTNCIIVEKCSNLSFYLGSLCVVSSVFPSV